MNQRKNILFGVILFIALVLFTPMFILREIGPIDFWWWMSINLIILISLGGIFFPSYFPATGNDMQTRLSYKIFLGIISAAILYFVFLAGNYISSMIIPGAASDISGIYAYKGEASRIRILLLMLLIIGPGEELFWRGFVQQQLMERIRPVYGFLIAAALYTGIHILTGNFMLVMAALTAGLFWGYMYLRFRSITINIISHVLWDITIFLILPIQ